MFISPCLLTFTSSYLVRSLFGLQHNVNHYKIVAPNPVPICNLHKEVIKNYEAISKFIASSFRPIMSKQFHMQFVNPRRGIKRASRLQLVVHAMLSSTITSSCPYNSSSYM